MAQRSQLEAFVAKLGVTYKVKIHVENNLSYINCQVLLPILSVDLKWFLKNAESPIHYVTVKKEIYVNKYGMTKLLGQSKEAVSFKLQDYLYELLYLVETNGTVSIEDSESRDVLLDELKLYKTIENNNAEIVQEATENLAQLKMDYGVLENKFDKLTSINEELEGELFEAKASAEHFKTIAEKLARYVRAKSKARPAEADDEKLELEDDDEISDLQVVEEAIHAKKLLKVKKAQTKKVQNTPISTYYLLRSAMESSPLMYSWELSDVQLSDDFIKDSIEFLSDEEGNQPPAAMIYYSKLHISKEKSQAISLFLTLNNDSVEENGITKLLNILL